jgi:hypothetical protein
MNDIEDKHKYHLANWGSLRMKKSLGDWVYLI